MQNEFKIYEFVKEMNNVNIVQYYTMWFENNFEHLPIEMELCSCDLSIIINEIENYSNLSEIINTNGRIFEF